MKIVLPTVESCPWRMQSAGVATCKFVASFVGEENSQVSQETCQSCCDSFPPNSTQWNPTVAGLIYRGASRQIKSAKKNSHDLNAAQLVKEQAESALEIDQEPQLKLTPLRANRNCHWLGEKIAHPSSGVNESGVPRETEFHCGHPLHRTTTRSKCRLCLDWDSEVRISRRLTLEELIPAPRDRCHDIVSQSGSMGPIQWGVGVTTSPRRQPTLEHCLDSLVRAGWDRPHLFLDGTCRLPSHWTHLPITWREERVGALPSWYMGLGELVIRYPTAGAYMMLQDDIQLHDRGSVREYLEKVLWPGRRPGVVSLFQSERSSIRGWFEAGSTWPFSAQALIFPPAIARALLSDPDVSRRWLEANPTKHIPIPDTVAAWCHGQGLEVWSMNPSLAQHIGNTSTIWMNAGISQRRRASWFSGSIEAPFAEEESLAGFPEDLLPINQAASDDYRARVDAGKARMRELSVVIGGVVRNARTALPRIAARVEHLGRMFGDYRVIIYEHDSEDATGEFLSDWKSINPRVDFVRERSPLAGFRTLLERSGVRLSTSRRNRLRELLLRHGSHVDYAILFDTDVIGGWSYEGIAHSFSFEDWDVIGSRGLSFYWSEHRCWSVTPVKDETLQLTTGGGTAEAIAESEQTLQRGIPLVPVISCGGGLVIYRWECLSAAEFGGDACEQIGFHKRLRESGFSRIFLNPSQITLHSPA